MKFSRFSSRFYVAAGIFVAIALFAYVGPMLLSGRKMNHVAGGLYDKPSGHAWLGTDNFGYDVFTNLMFGTRTSLNVGMMAGITAMVIGALIGTVAGYMGGWLDEILMAITNIILSIPQLVVLILISIALKNRSATSVALVIAVTAWPWLARAARAQASSVRTREHLDIAKLSGARTISIILFDVVPYMMSYIVMAFVLQVAGAISTEAALSLLGLGPTNTVSLGVMLNWALIWESVRNGAWWAFVPPTVLLTLIVFSLLMVQSSLDEVFNPRLQRGTSKLRARALKRLMGVPTPAGVPELLPTDASAVSSATGTGGTR